MRQASTMKCLIGIILVAAIGSTDKGIIAQGSGDPNVAPNPYRVDEDWAKNVAGGKDEWMEQMQ